jgi:hypothetical protein
MPYHHTQTLRRNEQSHISGNLHSLFYLYAKTPIRMTRRLVILPVVASQKLLVKGLVSYPCKTVGFMRFLIHPTSRWCVLTTLWTEDPHSGQRVRVTRFLIG